MISEFVNDIIAPSETRTVIARIRSSQWFNFEKNELFIFIAVFFLSTSYANFSPYAPVWLKGLFEVNSYLVLGLISVITNGMIAFATPIWGKLADKFDLKFFVIFGVGSLAIMYFSLIFVKTSFTFLIVLLIGNFFGAAQTGNMYALATLNVNKSKDHVLAKYSIVMSIAWLIVSPIAAFFYAHFDNAFTIQLSIAIGACLLSMVALSFVKEKKRRKKQEHKTMDSEDKSVFTTDSNNDSHSSILKSSKLPITNDLFLFSLILVLSFIFQATSGGFWSFNSLYFIDSLGLSSQQYSIFIITTTIVAIPVSMILSRIQKIKKQINVIVLFMTIQAIIYLLMTLFSHNAVLNLILYSIPMYPIYNISYYSLITSLSNRERRATAYGIFNSIGILGVIAGTLFLGYIADISPLGLFVMLRLTLLLASITLVISILLWLSANKIKKGKNS